ncbi:hypothetical protein BESB_013170 [Besnoitia besnoiti]|uniref:Uncharacterized protein n=1 Tax=Besnoitia besnoiti TaxID=94643 RepID=A0A2A9M415_BESBE|nr:hypothetical protein BESB_013170 [Besnoitia besnoiti]PFH32705.1 hypothetical protein BESB_013170 [Besnoitia besnoiti]
MRGESPGETLVRAGDEARRVQEWGIAERFYSAASAKVRGRGEKASIYARKAALLLDASSDPELLAAVERRLHLLPFRRGAVPSFSSQPSRSYLPQALEGTAAFPSSPATQPRFREDGDEAAPLSRNARGAQSEGAPAEARGNRGRRPGDGLETRGAARLSHPCSRGDVCARVLEPLQARQKMEAEATGGTRAADLAPPALSPHDRGRRPPAGTGGRGTRRPEALWLSEALNARQKTRGWFGEGELALVEQARAHAARALRLNPRSFLSLYTAALADVLAHRWRSASVLTAAALGVLTQRGFYSPARLSSRFRWRLFHPPGTSAAAVLSSSAPLSSPVFSPCFRATSAASPTSAGLCLSFGALRRALNQRERTKRAINISAMPRPLCRGAAHSPSAHRKTPLGGGNEDEEPPRRASRGAAEDGLREVPARAGRAQAAGGSQSVPAPRALPSSDPIRWSLRRFYRHLPRNCDDAASSLLYHSCFRRTSSEIRFMRREPANFQMYVELKLLQMRSSLLAGQPLECLRSLCGLLATVAEAEATPGCSHALSAVDVGRAAEEGLLLGAKAMCTLLTEMLKIVQREQESDSKVTASHNGFLLLDWPLLEHIQASLQRNQETPAGEALGEESVAGAGRQSAGRTSLGLGLATSVSPRASSALPPGAARFPAGSTEQAEALTPTWRDTQAATDAAALLVRSLGQAPFEAAPCAASIELLKALLHWSLEALRACFRSASERADYDRMAAAAAWRARCFLQCRMWEEAVRESTQALAVDLWTPAEVFCTPPPGDLSLRPAGAGSCASEFQAGRPLLSLFSPVHVRAVAHFMAGRAEASAADFLLARSLTGARGPSVGHGGERETHDGPHGPLCPSEDSTPDTSGGPEESGKKCQRGDPHKDEEAAPNARGSPQRLHDASSSHRGSMTEAARMHASADREGDRGSDLQTHLQKKTLFNPREPAHRWGRTPAEKARLKRRMENRSRFLFDF